MSFRTAVYRLELLAIRALLGCVALPKSRRAERIRPQSVSAAQRCVRCRNPRSEFRDRRLVLDDGGCSIGQSRTARAVTGVMSDRIKIAKMVTKYVQGTCSVRPCSTTSTMLVRA